MRDGVLRKVESGQCDVGTTNLTLLKSIGNFLVSIDLRGLFTAVYYRIIRCSAADVAILKPFFSRLAAALQPSVKGTCASYRSTVLRYNILASEVWDLDPRTTREELQQYASDAVLLSGLAFDTLLPVMDAWPTYPLGRPSLQPYRRYGHYSDAADERRCGRTDAPEQCADAERPRAGHERVSGRVSWGCASGAAEFACADDGKTVVRDAVSS